MKQFYLISLSIVFAMLFISCKNEKDALIADFEKFTQKASTEYRNCDEKAWQRLTDQYNELNGRYKKLEDRFSHQEIEKLNEFQGRFFSIRMKYETNRIKEKLKSEYDKARGFVDEFFNDQ